MASATELRPLSSVEPARRSTRLAGYGLAAAIGLMALAMTVPAVFGWNVHVRTFPPLHADWKPRVGPGTVPALLIGTVASLYAVSAAQNWPWRRLLVATWLASVGWMVSLATVDSWRGIGHILDTGYEYLNTARSVTDVSATLHEYVSRIPFSPVEWPVHVAGHPPGALLFFVGLVHLGLGSGLAAGWVVLLIAGTTPAAVLLTLQRLGVESAARTIAPFLVFGPAAIWMAVSADAVFGAVAAWALCALATAATAVSRRAMIVASLAAGVLFGCCVMMSYGLPLLGILAVAVLVAARQWSPLPWAAAAAAAVVLAFALSGFSWWEAYPVLRQRYWDGIASSRPTSYWLWGDLAALCFSAGPVLGSSVALALRNLSTVRGRLDRDRTLEVQPASRRTVTLIATAAITTILLADLSLMSKAEVERIWLPFVPWLLVGTALLPPHWRKSLLVVQVVTALLIQHLFATGW